MMMYVFGTIVALILIAGGALILINRGRHAQMYSKRNAVIGSIFILMGLGIGVYLLGNYQHIHIAQQHQAALKAKRASERKTLSLSESKVAKAKQDKAYATAEKAKAEAVKLKKQKAKAESIAKKQKAESLKQAKLRKAKATAESKAVRESENEVAETTTATPQKSGVTTVSSRSRLAERIYHSQQMIVLANNQPGFTHAMLTYKRSGWQAYGPLDRLNRSTDTHALLNQKLMPSSDRTELTWDPTGWHNKKTRSGWLYNRSHLIGYQFTGQNNNPRNLITGTQSMNQHYMLDIESKIANYLNSSASHYVRYEVTPIFKGTELVARGVEIRAQSLNSNTIKIHVYIFNVEAGYKINYSTGYSTVN